MKLLVKKIPLYLMWEKVFMVGEWGEKKKKRKSQILKYRWRKRERHTV